MHVLEICENEVLAAFQIARKSCNYTEEFSDCPPCSDLISDKRFMSISSFQRGRCSGPHTSPSSEILLSRQQGIARPAWSSSKREELAKEGRILLW